MHTRPLRLLLAAILAIAALPLHAAISDDHEAPHFQLIGAPPGTDVLPLKATQVRTHIAGVIAQVEVVQTYANTGSVPLEAIYVFPGSTRAAVQGMEIKVGDRIIKAQIQERAQAQRTYEQAKAQQKTASLLQQKRPNIFQMNVANIAPGAEVHVRLLYSEKLVPTERVYEFVLPGVVGPRYSKGEGGAAWQNNPFLAQGQPTPATLDFSMQLDAGLPVKSLSSPSHDVDIRFLSASSAAIKLKPLTDDASNRDLIIRYQLADQKISTGLLLHQGEDENFFLLNVQPPERITSAEVPARDYLFIVDVSGSMVGFPLNTAKQMMNDLLGTLRDKDRFNVLLFASDQRVLSETPLPATAANIGRATALIDSNGGGGGTELLPAMKRALAMDHETGTSRNLVLITDGFVTVETEAFDLIRENLGKANIFTFGIGTSVNRHLLESLAHVGKGEPFIITHPSECTTTARRFQQYISAPVLTNIQVRSEGFEVYDLEPANVPDLFADRPLEIVGKWKGQPHGRIIITGTTANGPYEAAFDVAVASTNHPALRPLWARERARILGDYVALNDDRAKTALKDLGLKYGLLTEQTSFVAVDEQPQLLVGNAVPVQQPLPLPQGVSQSAVGSACSVPEPGAMSLLMFALTVLALHRRR